MTSTILSQFKTFDAMLSNSILDSDHKFLKLPAKLIAAFPELLAHMEALSNLFGIDYDTVDYSFAVKVQDNMIVRVYEPSIMADENGETILCWCSESYPIETFEIFLAGSSYAVAPKNYLDSWELETACQVGIIFDPEKVFNVLKCQMSELPGKSTQLKKLARSGKLGSLLFVRGTNTLPVKAHEVLSQGQYEVVGYGSFNGEYQGRKFTSYHIDVVVDGKVVKVQAKGNVAKAVEVNPDISPDNPATLTVLGFSDAEYNGQPYVAVKWSLIPKIYQSDKLLDSPMPF